MTFISKIINSVQDPSPENMTRLGIGITIVSLVAIIYAMKDQERFAVLKKDFSNPIFITIFSVIIILSIIGLSTKNERLKNSTRHATIAFITAYLAHLNMAFAVFFIVGLFVYYNGVGIT